MTTQANNVEVLDQDEIDIINYLQEAERLRRRRAKIEEIRARMRELSGETPEPNNEEEDEKDETKPPDEKNASGDWSNISRQTADAASGIGRGLKEAPIQARANFKPKNDKVKANPNQNIYKYNGGDKFGMRQLRNGKGKLTNTWKVDKRQVATVNHLGTALLVIGVAMDAYEIAAAVKEDYNAGTKHNTVHTAAGVAGTWAGALPGAAYGAALGSAVPVVGSIIGGILGGVLGSMGGGMVARGIAEAAMPAPDQPVVDRTPGECAICSKKFEGFAAFYVHFDKEHEIEHVKLYIAVVQRIGEDRVDTEDTWFITKAFVKATDKVENWKLEDIIAFNDRIMDRIDWNEEES